VAKAATAPPSSSCDRQRRGVTEELAAGLRVGDDGRVRCWWPGDDPLYVAYHDDEWGRPVDDDTRLFEKLCLEGFQSGLSWLTILRKRPRFREAFHGFDPARIASFTDDDVDRLMNDAGIVRNRAKILATINNARRYPDLVGEAGSLAAFLWSYEPDPASRPASLDHDTLMSFSVSDESKRLSRDLRKRGWAFVGPTTAYAAMEAMGIVNDHLAGCFARAKVDAERAAFRRPTR
jgi:DNA-3-methyladenine glycosylase I